MKNGIYIKHERFPDVCFYVIEHAESPISFTLYGVWINIALKGEYKIKEDAFSINKEKLNEWYELEISDGRMKFWTGKKLTKGA